MSESLRRKTITALFWTFIESGGRLFISFFLSIIMARLLSPAEFGLIGMLSIFLVMSTLFFDGGLGQALVKKQDARLIDECSMFYCNIFIAVLAVLILCLCAPAIASFYNVPQLIPLTYALSLTIIISSFGLIQQVLLKKHLNYKPLVKVNLIALIVSGVAGIVFAWYGFGVWALVFRTVISNLLRTIFLWLLSSWRPRLIFSFSSIKEMLSFSWRIFVAGFFNIIFDNIYAVIIGKLFTPAELGFYFRGRNLQQLPSKFIKNSVSRTSFPVFSKLQDDIIKLKSAVRTAMTNLALVAFPVMSGLALVAYPLVKVLLTNKWILCVPYLQVLCFANLLLPFIIINTNSLKALGRPDLFFYLDVGRKILIVISIAISWKYGIVAMLIGLGLVNATAFILSLICNSRMIQYRLIEMIIDFAPVSLVTVIMGCAVWCVSYYLSSINLIVCLLIQIVTGGVVYIILCRLVKIPAFMIIWRYIIKKIKIFFDRKKVVI